MSKTLEKLAKKADKVFDKLAAEGKHIEAGWQTMRMYCLPPHAPEMQVDMLRTAFFTGATHLWKTLLPGHAGGALISDAKKFELMDELNEELEEFLDQTKKVWSGRGDQ